MKTPSNLEAEIAVLASVMLRNDVMADLSGTLTPEDFWHPPHRAVWVAMLTLHERRQPIDPVTLEARLRATDETALVGGLEGLGRLCDGWSTGHYVGHYASIVADVSRRRRLVLACRDVAERGSVAVDDEAGFVEEAERQILAASAQDGAADHLMPDVTVHATMASMFERMKRKDPVVGIATGITKLDHMIAGLQRKKLYVVAGRPRMGKSALAGNFALSAATLRRRGAPSHPSLTINLEMGPEEIMERHVWAETRKIEHSPGIHDRVRAGRVTEADTRVLCHAADRVHKSGMAIIDGVGMTAADITKKARRWRNSRDCGKAREGLIIVDYLQLIRPPRGKSTYNREQEVASISRDMKIMAKELDMPVLLLCQLNRGVEKREDHRPRLDDLRESGAIEQDADVILFVHRPCEYIPDRTSAEYQACADDAEIIVAKQRAGETGIIGCKYYGPYLSFENRPGDHED